MAMSKQRVKLIIVIAVGVLKLAYGDICLAAEAEERPRIFSGLPDSLTAQAKDQVIDPTVSRARSVTVNWSAVNDTDATSQKQAAGESGLTLNLFDDAIFRAVLDRREVLSETSVVWLGYVEGFQDSQVTLAVDGSVMAGNVRIRQSLYQVRYIGEGTHVLYQIDPTAFPPDSEPVVAPGDGK